MCLIFVFPFCSASSVDLILPKESDVHVVANVSPGEREREREMICYVHVVSNVSPGERERERSDIFMSELTCREERGRECSDPPDLRSDKYVAAPTCVGEIDRNLFLRFSHGYSHTGAPTCWRD